MDIPSDLCNIVTVASRSMLQNLKVGVGRERKQQKRKREVVDEHWVKVVHG